MLRGFAKLRSSCPRGFRAFGGMTGGAGCPRGFRFVYQGIRLGPTEEKRAEGAGGYSEGAEGGGWCLDRLKEEKAADRWWRSYTRRLRLLRFPGILRQRPLLSHLAGSAPGRRRRRSAGGDPPIVPPVEIVGLGGKPRGLDAVDGWRRGGAGERGRVRRDEDGWRGGSLGESPRPLRIRSGVRGLKRGGGLRVESWEVNGAWRLEGWKKTDKHRR